MSVRRYPLHTNIFDDSVHGRLLVRVVFLFIITQGNCAMCKVGLVFLEILGVSLSYHVPVMILVQKNVTHSRKAMYCCRSVFRNAGRPAA